MSNKSNRANRADRTNMSMGFITFLGLMVEENVGGEVGECQATHGLEAGHATGGATVNNKDAVTMGGEHGDNQPEEIGEAIETIHIKIVSARCKARASMVEMGVKHESHVKLNPTQTVGLYRGDKPDRANRPCRASG